MQAAVENVGDFGQARIELAQRIRTGRGQGDAGAFGGVVQRAVDFDQRRLQAAVERIELDRDAFVELAGQRAEHHFGFARAARDIVGNAAADLVERGADLVATAAQLIEQGRAAFGQQQRQRAGAVGDGARQGIGALFQRAGNAGGAGIQRFGQRSHAGVDGGGQLQRARLEIARHGRRMVFQAQRQAAGAIIDGGQEFAGAVIHQRDKALGAFAKGVG